MGVVERLDQPSTPAPVEECAVKRYSLSHLADSDIDRGLDAHVASNRSSTADLLAHLAEFDFRKRYLPAGYPSLFAYCVGRLHLSEDSTRKRIQAARIARRFPTLFEAVADGRLHLSAVVLLAPSLSPENADALIAAATHKSKAEVRRLLAVRFPRPAVEDRVTPIPAPPLTLTACEDAPGHIEPGTGSPEARHAPGHAGSRLQVTPLAPEAYEVRFTVDREAHDDLRYAQSLLGARAGSGEIGKIVGRALKLLIAQLEKRKFAATSRPRPGQSRAASGTRYVPANVKRAVWERDSGRCTFVSESGHRCEARTRIEFDHLQEFARGGEATVDGIRLRCRAHNQYTAEQTFGARFMEAKREAARARAEAKRRRLQREADQPAGAHRDEPAAALVGEGHVMPEIDVEHAPGHVESRHMREADESDVVPWLRKLGYSIAEARHAANCTGHASASLEERVRLALRVLLAPHRKISPVLATPL